MPKLLDANAAPRRSRSKKGVRKQNGWYTGARAEIQKQKSAGDESKKRASWGRETKPGHWQKDKTNTQEQRQRLGLKYKTGVAAMRRRCKQSGVWQLIIKEEIRSRKWQTRPRKTEHKQHKLGKRHHMEWQPPLFEKQTFLPQTLTLYLFYFWFDVIQGYNDWDSDYLSDHLRVDSILFFMYMRQQMQMRIFRNIFYSCNHHLR